VWNSTTGARSRTPLQLLRIGLDEQAYANAGVEQARDERRQLVVLPVSVEPAFGGALLAPFRHDAGGVRAVLERDRQHLVGCRHLQIERHAELRHQPGDVVVADVAPVLAQVSGDARPRPASHGSRAAPAPDRMLAPARRSRMVRHGRY
jgi:hypothetical protein